MYITIHQYSIKLNINESININNPMNKEKTIDIALNGFASKGSQNNIWRIILERLGFVRIKFIKTTTKIGKELSIMEYK